MFHKVQVICSIFSFRLLSAYNGISTSPLFIFGRAVFLGMTSKGNTASCRYAYSQCPTDPEELVHYLNNHNGGFFRFFNAPQPQIPQNVEQFYNQLSGQYGVYQTPGLQQTYGFYDSQHNPPPQNPDQPYGLNQPYIGVQQNYGTSNPQVYQGNQNLDQQYDIYQPLSQNVGPEMYYPNYGIYQSINPSHASSPNSLGNQYGLYNKQYLGPQNYYYANKFKYGPKYLYVGKYGFSNIRFKDKNGNANKIEKRIQNKPSYLYVDNNVGNVDINPKWIFPESSVKTDLGGEMTNIISNGKKLKFPEESIPRDDDSKLDNRRGKSFLFPESQKEKYLNYYEYPPVSSNDNFKLNYQQYNIVNSATDNKYNNKYGTTYNNRLNNGISFSNENVYNNGYMDSNSNLYSKYMYSNEEEDGVQTVYIVRGNGDPNNPEIVKIRPGEKIML